MTVKPLELTLDALNQFTFDETVGVPPEEVTVTAKEAPEAAIDCVVGLIVSETVSCAAWSVFVTLPDLNTTLPVLPSPVVLLEAVNVNVLPL